MDTNTPKTHARNLIGTLLLVFACFTLSSSAYLAWLYHLITLVPPESADALSMGVGYACQGIGIAIMAVIARVWPEVLNRTTIIALITLLLACTAPAALSDSLAGTLAFGYAANTLCGAVSLFYLTCLASFVNENRRGIVFGGGYACSIVASWLISLIDIPIAGIPLEFVACAAFSIMAAVIIMVAPFNPLDSPVKTEAASPAERGVIVLACFAVLLMSIEKNTGFNFPAADIGATVNLELSRLFYAAGLIAAGIVFDRSRKLGATLCIAALVTPFALLALTSQPLSSAVLWAVDYFFYGFFSAFRILLFADLAARYNRMILAGFGLMIGRFGDALGLAVCLSLGSSVVAIVSVGAMLLVATVLVLYKLFPQVYETAPVPERSERELFDAFTARHELSPRERDVVRMVLDNHTNAEIAAALFVSESTVKFHMRNVLKKTDCKNRTELLAKFTTEIADFQPE